MQVKIHLTVVTFLDMPIYVSILTVIILKINNYHGFYIKWTQLVKILYNGGKEATDTAFAGTYGYL